MNLILLAVVCLIFLTIFEIVLRITEEEEQSNDLLIYDNETLYLMKPNLEYHVTERDIDYDVKTNNDGFRDIDFENYLYKNKIILNLGDSFTYGKGVEVEETFSDLIEERTDYSVLNLGLSGYTTFQEYYLGKRYAEEYDPEIIILNVFYSNDLAENIGIINRSLDREKDSTEGRHSITTTEKIKAFFRETLNLRTYMFFAEKVDNFLINVGAKPPIRVNSFTLTLFDKSKENDKELISAYEKTFLYIDKINNLTNEKNSKLLVVLIPPRLQVDNLEWEETTGKYTTGDENFIRDLPNQIFKEYLKEENIAYIDLLPTFIEVDDGSYYYKYDGHWTAKGHDLAAENIIAKIQ